MKQSKKQDVAIAKLNMAIGDIANQLIKNNIKLPRKNPRYANKLGKKPMRGGGAIDNETIQSIKQFLDDNKDTVIQLKNKLILDIYDYIIKCCSNDPDEKNYADIYIKIKYISTTLFDNTKDIYDYNLNKDIYAAKELGKYVNKEIKENDINNTIYILQFINIYYTIFDKNKKITDTDTFGNNTINLDELFKGTLFEENSDIEKNKKNFVGAYDTFKRRIEGDEKIVVEHEVRNDKELPAAAQPIVSTAEEDDNDYNDYLKTIDINDSPLDKKSYLAKLKKDNEMLNLLDGGKPHPKYKSTGRIVCIMYKKRKYKRTVYVKGKRDTKYCKIDGEYILLSKMKVIEGH